MRAARGINKYRVNEFVVEEASSRHPSCRVHRLGAGTLYLEKGHLKNDLPLYRAGDHDGLCRRIVAVVGAHGGNFPSYGQTILSAVL